MRTTTRPVLTVEQDAVTRRRHQTLEGAAAAAHEAFPGLAIFTLEGGEAGDGVLTVVLQWSRGSFRRIAADWMTACRRPHCMVSGGRISGNRYVAGVTHYPHGTR